VRSIKKTISALLCFSLIANNTSSIMALSLNENNAQYESTQTITLDGEVQKIEWTTPDSINLGEEFDAMSGVKALDKEGNDITNKVNVSGSVDTSKLGEYKIEYFIQGEEDKKFTRIITVTDENKNEDTLKTEESSKDEGTSENEDASKNEESEEIVSESLAKTQIVGDKILRVYQGDSFDTKFDIKATDEKGQDITSKVQVKGNVDTNKLGEYKLEYSVKSDLGEEATFERTVKVIEKNVFNFYINEENKDNNVNKDIQETPNSETVVTEEGKKVGFSLYLDLNTSKFLVNNQSPEMLDRSKPKEVYANIKVFDKENNEKLSLELLGEDTGTSEKLNPLKELEYSFGDYIEIKIANAKDGFNITGEMSGDIDTKNPKDPKDTEDVKKEDYSDGVDNIDYLNNVRFKIIEEGIETVYNNAPVISGLEPMEKLLTNKEKQLEGVKVTDDHDGVIPNDKISITEEKDDNNNVIALKYKVSDSWGRSTEAIRIVALIEAQSISLLNITETTKTTLEDNIIAVKGIKFGSDSAYGDAETRFKITFNDRSRKIYVIEQDGRSMNSRIKDTYFKMTLYDSKGNKKREVELNGDDRSNTSKLDELRYYGWPYQYGDQISIWHYEAPVKITITGEVTQNQGEATIDFSSELTKELLETTRFDLTATGLSHALNAPPVVVFPDGDEGLVVTRGDEVNLLEDVNITDDKGVVSTEISTFDSTKLGEQFVTYTVTDNWGVTTNINRKVTVVPKNKIEENLIKVKSIDGTQMFSIGFDEIKKEFILKTENTSVQLNPSNNSTELTITVYKKTNVKKREFKISGKDTVDSASIQKLNNYKYEEGDYLRISPTDPSLVTIDGEIEDKPLELDYASGIDLDKWINVRFQLSEGKFKYNYNQAPTINGNSDITIERGDEVDVLSGMTVRDDKDGDVELTESNTTVTLKSGKDIFLGNQVYEIRYTDSWGRSSSVDRKVIINPKNPVEEYQIELFDGDKTVLSFAYDSIDKKFKVLSYDPEYSFLNSGKENAFVLEFYDYETYKKQKEVVLKSEDLIDNDFLTELTSIIIEDNWYMKLWYHDYNKLKVVSGENASDDTSTTDISFANEDEMENTRFEISKDGITSIYNEAPEIKGIDDVTIVYGSEFDNMNEVSVEDEYETEDLREFVIISGEVHTNELGPHVLRYEVTDRFGRTTSKTRTVTVVPVYTVNEVKYHNDSGEEIFSIGINESATGFTVNLPQIIPTGTRSSNFEFRVFNGDGEKVSELIIDSEMEISKALFRELNGLIIRPGYSFSVNSTDITKIKVTGGLNKAEKVESVDYANLKDDDKDKVENVRFKLTENIVEVIYNEKPEIIIEQSKADLVRNQAIVLEDYDLLEGLSIKDDKDNLTLDKIEIELPGDKNILTTNLDEAKDLIGKTVTITYQVADSWGRLSDKVTRNLTIESAMDDIEFDFLYAESGLVPDKQNSALKIKFNMETGRLDFTEGSSEFKYNNAQYGSFAILDKDNNIKYAVVLGKQKDFEKADSIFNSADVLMINNVSNFISNIDSKRDELEREGKKLIEYGDKLIIKSFQSPFFYIDGKVIDNQEDYSKGASIGAILERSEFEVTPAGLKQIYTGPTISNNGSSQLTLYNIVAGIQSVNIWLDTSNPDNLVLKAEALDNEWFDTLQSTNKRTIRLEVYNADGTNNVRGSYGRTRPDEIANHYNDVEVEEHGYLKIIWYETENIKNSKLYNLRDDQYGFENKVDYEGDITDPTYFSDVRFYFTKTGIIPVYNSAPTFEGIDDTSISLNENFDKTQGVTVKDFIDEDISTFDVTGDVDNTRVGENTLNYSATDSWGRTGTYERKVYVKQKIHENHFEVYNKDKQKSFSIDFEPELSEGAENGKLKITQFSDEPLDIDRPTEEIFKVWIYNKDGSIKKNVTLLGRDNSSSEKLNVLNDIEYSDGDYIKVWRAPNKDADDASIEGVKVTGNVSGSTFDFADAQNGIDHMNNTIFYIKPNGLEAFYNAAPELHGVKDDIVIYYGDTYNLLSRVTATDDIPNSNLTVKVTPETISVNKIGTTEITYSVTDSLGRTTSQSATVTVRSKSYLNYFDIYGDSNSGVDERKFSIGFNPEVNAFVFYNSSGEASLDTIDLSKIPSDLKIVLYSRFGREKVNIQLLENDTEDEKRQKLRELQSVKVELLDMIQISTSKSSKVKLKGNVVNSSDQYENGFTSEEEMRSVRFQVKNEGLTEVSSVSSDQVTFNGLTKLTIKRGDDVDLTAGVSVIHPNEILTDIEVTGFNNKETGEQVVTYSVKDSWGTTFTEERTIEVTPFNKLEEVRVTVSDRDSTELIKLKFDALESSLSYELNDTSTLVSKLRRVLSFAKGVDGDTVVLTVSTFNEDMSDLDSISITKDDIINKTNLDDIYNIPFVEGGFIGIDIYDFNEAGAIDISGPVTYPDKSKNHYQDMRHVRYSISEEGIEAVYNEAPNVITKDVEHIISEDFDLNSALTVKDDKDEAESIEIEFSEYDPYKVGNYEVTATVTDLWGLDTKADFKVYVLSYLDDNSITLKSDTDKKLVTIGFNSKIGKIDVEFHNENDNTQIISQSYSNDPIIKFSIYNEEQENVATIPLNSTDTIETIKEKLEENGFVDYSYHYNYFIGIEVVDSAKGLVSIRNVYKEDDELESVNYENGVTDIDHFNNVRFELDPYGLTAIYNKVPIIIDGIGEVREAVKSLNVKDYNLLDGIDVTDDKDKLNVDNIKIKYNDSEEASALKIGENTITLTIKDNWGRESDPVTFKLKLISAMNNISIDLLYAGEGFIPDLDKKAAKLTFNMDDKKILVDRLSDNDLFKFNNHQYGAFAVYDESDVAVFKGTLGTNNNLEESESEFISATKYKNVSAFKTALENISIDYGYKIKIKIYQSPFVYINGVVNNAQEDYSEGAYLSEILNESTFTITEEGLVQNYTKQEATVKNNDIVWLSGVAGQKLFNINVNPDTKKLIVTSYSTEPLDTMYKEDTELFSIHVYDENDKEQYGITATTLQKASDIFDALNDKSFEFGWYMKIKILPTDRNRVKNMKIYGEIKKADELKEVDYSDEIRDVAYFNESKFYFTENGLSLNYNYAPEFTGLTDIILLKGDIENVDLKDGVSVNDDNTSDIEYSIEDVDGNPIDNPESYRPPSLGAHEVYYVAEDSLGRVAREPRFIWLQASSEINIKDQSLLTVREADPSLQTEEDRLKYLINLVTVYDEEDDANNNPIKITENNIEGTFDPNIPNKYPIKYTVQDSDGNVSEETFEINVVRTISVSVPTYIPFQLVTNLIKNPDDPTSVPDPFVSGVMNVTNNYLTDVEVYLKEFTKQSDSGDLEIVKPDKFSDWNNLTEEETMKYMALGIYSKDNFNNSSYTKDSPLWLETNTNDSTNDNAGYIGTLSKATSLTTPNIGKLSFVSKHGNKFIGGTTKGKFNLVLEFR
jgi:hypothetical protein